jgi:hypothetical protein
MQDGTANAPAAETAEQYKARIGSYVGENDSITWQRDAPHTLAGLVEGRPDEVLSRRPAPGKWSIRAILAHLAEDELVSSWRYRQMIEHNGATLPGFDQDEWARLGDYESWTAREALEMFRLLREANLRMLGRLTPEEWQRYGTHAERGRITVEDLACHMAGHDQNHIMQVRRALEQIWEQSSRAQPRAPSVTGKPLVEGGLLAAAGDPEGIRPYSARTGKSARVGRTRAPVRARRHKRRERG